MTQFSLSVIPSCHPDRMASPGISLKQTWNCVPTSSTELHSYNLMSVILFEHELRSFCPTIYWATDSNRRMFNRIWMLLTGTQITPMLIFVNYSTHNNIHLTASLNFFCQPPGCEQTVPRKVPMMWRRRTMTSRYLRNLILQCCSGWTSTQENNIILFTVLLPMHLLILRSGVFIASVAHTRRKLCAK